MKKILVIFTISLLILNCNRVNKISYSENDNKFQDYIGKQKTKALNRGIKEFEDWLMTSIGNKNIEDNYRQYLQYIAENAYDNIPWDVKIALSSETRKLIRESELYNDFFNSFHYHIYFDTIKHETYRIRDSEDSLIIIPIRNRYKPGSNIDSIRKENSYEIRFNLNGKYFNGLRSYSKDTIIISYIMWMDASSGGLSPISVADLFLQNGVNYNDYLTKVVLFQEFCYY